MSRDRTITSRPVRGLAPLLPLLLALVGCRATAEISLPKGRQAPLETNKALARVWFEDVINRRDLDAIDAHYATGYVHHGPDGAELHGIPRARAVASAILAASSDRVATVEQQVAEGNLVTTRFTSRGTHTGTFRGLAPTGKEWVTEGICISRIEHGKIAEDWEIVHSSGL